MVYAKFQKQSYILYTIKNYSKAQMMRIPTATLYDILTFTDSFIKTIKKTNDWVEYVLQLKGLLLPSTHSKSTYKQLRTVEAE